MARYEHVVCPFCPLLCDDVTVEVEGGRVVAAEGCPTGQRLFTLDQHGDAPPMVEGRVADLTTAVQRAATLLVQARRPLALLLGSQSSEAASAAAALAAALGGVVDGPPELAGTLEAMTRVGLASASLGEVRNRADTIVLWRTDPAVSHPCLARRFIEAPGLYRPSGRADRMLIGVHDHAAPGGVDEALALPSGGVLETLWALRAAVRGPAPHGEVGALAGRLRAARYGALLYDANAPMAEIAGLLALVDELNTVGRWAAFGLFSTPNAWGTAAALAGATGYGRAVSFGEAGAQHNGDEFAAPTLLGSGWADALLVVGAGPGDALPFTVPPDLSAIPTVAVGVRPAAWAEQATVWLPVGQPGVAAAGTMARLDRVALPLRALVESPWPADHAMVRLLLEEVVRRVA